MIAWLIGVLAVSVGLWIALYKFERNADGSNPTSAWSKSPTHAATVVSSLAAAGAIVSAVYTYVEGAKLQRELAASAIWREYLSSAIENPGLAEGRRSVADSLGYDWFVGHAFHAAESIVLSKGDDSAWMAAVCETIQKLRTFIMDASFPIDHYDGPMRELIDSVRANRPCPTQGLTRD